MPKCRWTIKVKARLLLYERPVTGGTGRRWGGDPRLQKGARHLGRSLNHRPGIGWVRQVLERKVVGRSKGSTGGSPSRRWSGDGSKRRKLVEGGEKMKQRRKRKLRRRRGS